jgi:hypothetical protein
MHRSTTRSLSIPQSKYAIRRVTLQTKRKMRRRSAIRPVIGHLKVKNRTDRNYHSHNAIAAAAGYNCGSLIRWLRSQASRTAIISGRQ